ncbi:MAG: amidohydrolase family protein [Rhodothermaceae bacterium]|nr:amidohydrolase family protein [Rhodothermaceae bacterium]
MRFLTLLLLVLLAFPAQAQDRVIRTEQGTFALLNARIETITNGTIERGTVVLRDGVIEAVGTNVTPPADAQVIDAEGLTLYPGFIDGGTQIGLQEVGSQPETQDYNELGEVTPQMQALTAVNPNSVHFPIARVAGVTAALTSPTGGLMPGTAALVRFHGYTPAQMDTGFRGVALNFPNSARRGAFDRRTDEDIKKQFEEAMERLDETWDQALLFARIDSAGAASGQPQRPAYQPEMEALLPVLRGSAALLVEVNAAADILKALEWLEGRDVRAILTGVAEGWRVADHLATAGLPVITGPVLSMPTRGSDRYDRAYQNAALLRQAGLQVALRTREVENVRNLPFNAGFAVAWGRDLGFDRQAALEAITIAPARMFGVEDQLGSIEVGKAATLFAADGDPFEPSTQVQHLFIDGYQIPIESRQISLYEEFLNRNPGLTR